MLISKSKLTNMDEFVKNLISSGEYSLYFSSNTDKYFIQTSASDFFELTSLGDIVKKIDYLEEGTEEVYFNDNIESGSAIQNFSNSLYY